MMCSLKRGFLIVVAAFACAGFAMLLNAHGAPQDALLGTDSQTYTVDPATGTKIPQVDIKGTSGAGVYAIERTNISTSSVNLAFGMTSGKLELTAYSSNTADICVDFSGGTAVCPSANTAGHYRLKPGKSIMMDDMKITSVSLIAGRSPSK